MSNISELCYMDVPSTIPHDYYLFPFERNFDYWSHFYWFMNNWWLSFYIIAGYLLLIVAGQRFMRYREPYDLRVPIIVWNAFLALVSITAVVRCLQTAYMVLQEVGYYGTLCQAGSHESRIAGGFWSHLIVVFKAVELGDTAFIVLRKKQLIFLHWYHHATVVIFAWASGAYPSAVQAHFLMANIIMHAFVYSYYTLKALRVPISRRVNIAITSLQILEMMYGVFVTWTAYRLKAQDPDCCVFDQAIRIATAIYASYFVLFLNFFVKSYIKNDGVLFDEKGAFKKMQ